MPQGTKYCKNIIRKCDGWFNRLNQYLKKILDNQMIGMATHICYE